MGRDKMICANCSFTLPDNAVFCGNCGTPTPTAAVAPPPSPPPPPPPSAAPTASIIPPAPSFASTPPSSPINPVFTTSPDGPRRKKPIGLFIGAGVAVAAIIVAAIVLLGGDDDPDSAEDAGSANTTEIITSTDPAGVPDSITATTTGSTDAVAETTDATTATTDAATTTTVAPIEMPDLSGLTEAEARTELEAAGITTALYTPVPQAGDAGQVLSQSPRAGSLDLTAVEIKISQAVVMPALGQTDAAATQTLLQDTYGATVTLTEVFDPASTVGTVISTDPVADGTLLLPAAVTLTVSGAGTEVFLDEVAVVDSPTCEQGAAKVNTYQSAHAMYCSFSNYSDAGDANNISYDINRSASLLRFTAGLDDSSPADGRVRIVVYGDGNKLWERDYGLGESSDEAIPVAGVLRLQVEMVFISGSNIYTYGVLADARLAGDSTQIANVPRRS